MPRGRWHQLRRRESSGSRPIRRRERTSGIDRVGDQRRRDSRQDTRRQIAAPCRNVSRFPRLSRNDASKIQAISRRQEQVRQAQIDGQGRSAIRPARSEASRWRCGASTNRRRRQPAHERANHHGRRHRVARLGRIDHQVDRDIAEDGRERQRNRASRAGYSASRAKPKIGHDRRQRVERDHLKAVRETAPAQTRSPADTE